MKGFAKFLVVILIIVFMIALGGAAAVYYENWEKNLGESNSKFAQFLSQSLGSNPEEKVLEPNFTCLIMGRNQALTDFIMLCQFNPNTREASLMSIPRDTFVGNASYDGKINSVYANKGVNKILEKVTEITGVEVEHYVVFDAKLLKKVVNAIGGVTVNVPINMDYDDPVQDLHIHLKKGVQTLDGDQAEGFVRFRKDNNGYSYPNGDIGRVAAQQSFIKAMIEQMLKPENIKNISNIVKIVLDGTKTDITMSVVEEYMDDAITFKMDRLRVGTLPGLGQYTKGPDGLTRSFYIYNEVEAEKLIDELFFMSIADVNKQNSPEEDIELNGSDSNNEIQKDDDKTQEVVSPSLKDDEEDKKEPIEDENREVKVEVLSAKAKTSRFNKLVSDLNAKDCNVIKIGNYPTTKVESSRIIVYGKHTEKELDLIKEISGIKKVEHSTEDTKVTFTIVIGANY